MSDKSDVIHVERRPDGEWPDWALTEAAMEHRQVSRDPTKWTIRSIGSAILDALAEAAGEVRP